MIGSTFETIKKHGITDEDVKEGLYIKVRDLNRILYITFKLSESRTRR